MWLSACRKSLCNSSTSDDAEKRDVDDIDIDETATADLAEVTDSLSVVCPCIGVLLGSYLYLAYYLFLSHLFCVKFEWIWICIWSAVVVDCCVVALNCCSSTGSVVDLWPIESLLNGVNVGLGYSIWAAFQPSLQTQVQARHRGWYLCWISCRSVLRLISQSNTQGSPVVSSLISNWWPLLRSRDDSAWPLTGNWKQLSAILAGW